MNALQPATLRALVEEFITREGTDYGEVERSLEDNVKDVMTQLERGTAAIEYDEESSSCTLVVVDPREVRRRRDD